MSLTGDSESVAINYSVSALVSATGTVTLSFPQNPGTGNMWIVNLTVPNAPSAGQFSLTAGFQSQGTWTGPAPFGPVKLTNQETAVISGSGLQPGLVLVAQMIGYGSPDDGTIVLPNNVPQTAVSVETIVSLMSGKVIAAPGGIAAFTVTPPLNARRLTIIANLSAAPTGQESIVLIGNPSNTVWYNPLNNHVPFSAAGPPFPLLVPIFTAIEPTIDNTYLVFLSGAPIGSNVTFWILASMTNPDVTANINGPIQVSPIVNGESFLFFAALVETANGTFPLTSTVPSGQFLYFNEISLMVAGSANAIIAGVTTATIYDAQVNTGVNNRRLSGLKVNSENLNLIISGLVGGATVYGSVSYMTATQ